MNGHRLRRGVPASTPPLQAAFAWAGALPLSDEQGAVVLSSVENLYSGPDTSRDVVTQALLGQVLVVLESSAGFMRVQTPDGYRGWIAARAISLSDDGGRHPYASRGDVAEITSLIALGYRAPTVTRARPTHQAPLGTRLELLSDAAEPGWLICLMPDGLTAFVQSGDAQVGKAQAVRRRESPEAVIATARRYLGVPYLWGGMSPLGVDCSGLMSRAHEVNGVRLMRDAWQQFEDPRGRTIARDALLPGDLVFFGETRIAHVGLCVGEERFIHATTHGTPTVQESALTEPHWAGLYRGARRMP